MRRPVVVLALLAVLLVPSLMQPRAAEACSSPGPSDRVVESDIIIAGWVVEMRLAPLELQVPYPNKGGATAAYRAGEFYPVWVDFEVDRYFKGSGPQTISALDPRSVIFFDGQTEEERAAFESADFMGAGGSCGALDEDPRGQYWVIGLTTDDASTLTMSRGRTFTTPNPNPQSAEVLTAIAELEQRLGPGVTPAATGHGLAPATDRGIPIVLGVIGLAILGGARLATRGRPGR